MAIVVTNDLDAEGATGAGSTTFTTAASLTPIDNTLYLCRTGIAVEIAIAVAATGGVGPLLGGVHVGPGTPLLGGVGILLQRIMETIKNLWIPQPKLNLEV